MKDKIKLRLEDSRFDNILVMLCPHCGQGNLHHIAVTMYNRLEEDGAATVCHSEIESKAGYSDTGTTAVITNHSKDNSNNPSLRRSGLRIALECEICETLSDFCLAQHKGQTHVWMEILEGKKYGY